MKLVGVLFIFSFLSSIHDVINKDRCILKLDQLSKRLFIDLYIDCNKYRWNLIENTVALEKSWKIFLDCPNSYFQNLPHDRKGITIRCVKNETFEIVASKNKTSHKFNIYEVDCAGYAKPSIRKKGNCASNGTSYDVQYGDDKSYTIFQVCFDERTRITIYSYIGRSKVFYGSQNKVPRVPYARSGVIDYPNIYQSLSIESIFTKIFESKETARRYLKDDLHSIVPMQLTPKANFIWGIEQFTTFIDINTVPVWKILRDGIWKELEYHVQWLLKNDDNYFIVSGVHDVLRLKNSEGNYRKIYLSMSKDILPVPKYIWKIVYDWKQKFGMVVILVNDPFMTTLRTKDMLNCKINNPALLSKMRLPENGKHVGFIYFCEMEEFLDEIGCEELMALMT